MTAGVRASRPQQQLAQHRAALEHLVRPYRLGERQAGMDARPKLTGGEHVDEGAHAGAALLDEVVPGVDGELPHRRRVSARAQRRLQVELRASAERAVKDERAAGREQCDVVGNARSRDRVDDGVDAEAAPDLLDPLADLLALAVDDVIRPEIAGEARLL